MLNIRRLTGVLQKHKWENCMTIDRKAWTHRRNAVLADYLTPHDIITALVETVRCAFILYNRKCLSLCLSVLCSLYTASFERICTEFGMWHPYTLQMVIGG